MALFVCFAAVAKALDTKYEIADNCELDKHYKWNMIEISNTSSQLPWMKIWKQKLEFYWAAMLFVALFGQIAQGISLTLFLSSQTLLSQFQFTFSSFGMANGSRSNFLNWLKNGKNMKCEPWIPSDAPFLSYSQKKFEKTEKNCLWRKMKMEKYETQFYICQYFTNDASHGD